MSNNIAVGSKPEVTIFELMRALALNLADAHGKLARGKELLTYATYNGNAQISASVEENKARIEVLKKVYKDILKMCGE